MKKLLTILFWVFVSLHTSQAQRGPANPSFPLSATNIEPHTIVVKLKNNEQSENTGSRSLPDANFQGAIDNLRKKINAVEINELFPSHHSIPLAQGRSTSSSAYLSGIVKIKMEAGEDIWEVIASLQQDEDVIYAEPYYLAEPLYIPNDPQAAVTGAQQYLSVIKAYQAWDITRGSKDIIIGVLDTGVKMNHEDLSNQIYTNTADPVNGIDDDGDGYIDNHKGWDMADNNNNPEADQNGHGTEVAGVSSAEADNGKGIAGIGFNAQLMPVKVFRSSDGSFNRGYEAIVYAADRGCKVINLSWGSPGSFSQFAQDIINYAVLEKDVVIIAAAGNVNEEVDYYPASYQNVLSVGASDMNDNKASFGTYSTNIDLMAPGVSVFTTINNGTYGQNQGSSFSAPMVAGAAALLRAHFPKWNARQIMQQLRVSADNIYNTGNNSQFFEKLGKGRLNIHKALNDTLSPAVRMTSFNFRNKIGKYVFHDDTLFMQANFINYLNDAHNLNITLSCNSPYVTIVKGDFQVNNLPKMQEVSNKNNQFIVYLHPDLPANAKLKFRLGFNSGSYTDFQYFEFQSTPNFIRARNNELQLQVSGNGELGYLPASSSSANGVAYKGKKILDHMGIIIAQNNEIVLNNVINNFWTNGKDQDFQTVTRIKSHHNSEADKDFRAVFKSKENSGLNLKIEKKILSFNKSPQDNYLVLEYRITNLGASDIAPFKIGVYADWNLGNKNNNKAAVNTEKKLAHVFNTGTDQNYAGIGLLSAQELLHYAIDLGNHNGNTAELESTFSRTQKFNFLNNSKEDAGTNGNGNDVAHIVGSSVPLLRGYESIKIAFLVAAGESLEDLMNLQEKALIQYQQYLQKPAVVLSAELCEGQSVTLSPPGGTTFNFYADHEKTLLLKQGASYELANALESKTIYVATADAPYESDLSRILVVVANPQAEFKAIPDTLFLNDIPGNQVRFSDQSNHAKKWRWNFGNGFLSTLQNPITRFTEPGIYKVRLEIENSPGCFSSIEKDFVVAKRNEKPVITDLQICKNSSVVISAQNTNKIKIYTDSALKNMIFSGDSFETGSIPFKTTYYVTNTDGEFESLPVPVHINPFTLEAGFAITTDSTQLQKGRFILTDKSRNAETYEWAVNGQVISNENNAVFQIGGNSGSYEIKLKVESAEGCTDEIIKIIEPAISETPVVQNMKVCKQDEAVIQPENGKSFYFYTDEALQNLIHIGRFYTTGKLGATSTYYVTSVDAYLESSATKVEVEVDPFKVDFIMIPAELNLAEGDFVEFVSNTPNAIEWFWRIGNGNMQSAQTISNIFTEEGTYEVTLMATSNLGCRDTITKELKVVMITALTNRESGKILLYPNPAEDKLIIELPSTPLDTPEVILFNNQGQKLIHQPLLRISDRVEIPVAHLPKGMYLLNIMASGSMVYSNKVLIR